MSEAIEAVEKIKMDPDHSLFEYWVHYSSACVAESMPIGVRFKTHTHPSLMGEGSADNLWTMPGLECCLKERCKREGLDLVVANDGERHYGYCRVHLRKSCKSERLPDMWGNA